MRVAAALLLCGCSLVGVVGPTPSAPGAAPVHCTTDNVAPVLDVILAVASGVVAGYSYDLFETSTGRDGQTIGLGGMVVSIPLVILTTLSAGVGFGRTAACRDVTTPLR